MYVTYVHDLYGAVTDIRLSGSTSLSAYAYDDLGRLTGVTRNNGAATSYGYDAVSRLTTLTQNPTGSTNDVTITLGYSPAGQIYSRATSNSAYVHATAAQTDAYTNNGLNQVTDQPQRRRGSSFAPIAPPQRRVPAKFLISLACFRT